MKKHLLIFTFIYLSILCIQAQLITVDGDNSDWAEIPILSEPGVFPYTRIYVTGDQVFYMVEVADEAGDFTDNPPYDALRAYIDADRNKETGRKSDWLYIDSGNDYDITSVISPWNGSTMYWSDQSIQRQYSKTTAEAGFDISQLADSYEADYAGEKIPLSDNFGISFSYKINGSGETYIPANNYDFAYRNAFSVKPRSILSEDVSGKIELNSSVAYYMPFMKDENINDYLDFESGAYPAQNPDHWASWAVDIIPGIYDVKLNSMCDDGGKLEFYLVDMATNEVVFTSAEEEIWFQKSEEGFSEQDITELDFNGIAAGKYMLKLKNITTWAANLKVKSLILERKDGLTNQNLVDKDSLKLWINGNKLHIHSNYMCSVQVYSLSGTNVFSSENINAVETYLSQGIYVVKTIISQKTYMHKIIIQ